MNNTIKSICAGACLLGMVSTANAIITVTNTTGTNYAVDFDPITFTANGGKLGWLVFEDFFTANTTESGTGVSGTVDISIDGAAAVSHNLVFSNGTFNGTLGALDQNDLYFNIATSGPTPTAGQTVLVTANNLVFASGDVPTSVTTPVNVTFYNNGPTGTASTNVVSADVVPEPSSTALLGLGGLALLLRRRK